MDSTEIESRTGVQQGDPLGSLTFSLAIDPIIRSISTPVSLWYLDDGTLVGPPDVVAENITALIPKFRQIGLELNKKKM